MIRATALRRIAPPRAGAKADILQAKLLGKISHKADEVSGLDQDDTGQHDPQHATEGPDTRRDRAIEAGAADLQGRRQAAGNFGCRPVAGYTFEMLHSFG
jgi:hypothetical protein